MSGVKMPKISELSGKLLSNFSLQFALPQTPGINWDIAAAIALDSSANEPLKDRENLQQTYYQIVEVINPLIEQITGLKTQNDNQVLICDRHEWIVRTTGLISMLFEDLIKAFWDFLEKQGASKLTKKTSSALITTEIGLLLSFLSTKVLGQYDLGLPSKDSDDLLFIVEPNIALKEKLLKIEGAPFRFWILAHELTHKLQFKHFSWLKAYYYGLVNQFTEVISSKTKTDKADKNQLLKSLSLLVNKENWQLLAKTQSFMSFIEGYADFVMFHVGKMLPRYELMEPIFSRRQRVDTSVMKRLLEKVIGLDMKKSQYRQGLAFVAQISKLKSLMFLNEQMDSPEKLPTLRELTEPKKWLSRIGF